MTLPILLTPTEIIARILEEHPMMSKETAIKYAIEVLGVPQWKL